MTNVSNSTKVYELIDSKTGSNMLMQAISGVAGFPYTLLADAGVIFTHYGPMLNEIRKIYGLNEIDSKVLAPIIKGCSTEILSDLLLDKVIGQIPLIGIAANVICAKAMTWRLGLMFAMVSAKGEDFTSENVKKSCELIRTLFPQKNSVKFQKPSPVIVEKLLNTFNGCSAETFNDKIEHILDSLAN